MFAFNPSVGKHDTQMVDELSYAIYMLKCCCLFFLKATDLFFV